MVREKSKNGRWKGGITQFKSADELLKMPQAVVEVRKRLLNSFRRLRNGCWQWVGKKFKDSGRACLSLGRNNHLAYRLAFVVWKGSTKGLCVLHTCDNPACINPEHLWIGTNAANSDDMKNKLRQAWGSKNGATSLTDEDVLAIRREVGNRKLYGIRKQIAARYGVHPEVISRIVAKKTWRFL